ncbi:MAG: hypothetical protein JHD16_13120, partial [Solirubrobacteraceae bacterium]|nr:hypothetical protein [Solirubrobacteraceae bacterium]
GPTVSRTWTVDATPPSVIIDSAPAGETADPGATIVFASSEPDGASFKCRVDGGEFFDCPSPLRLDGLAAGEHGVEVVTVDRAGNVSQPVSRFWTVVVPPPAPPVTAECAPGDQASVAFGVLVVIATQPSSCLRPTTFQGQAAFAATGPVRVNGIDVRPAGPGDRIIVSQALGQGTVRSDGQAILSLDGKDLGPAQELDFSNLDVAVHNKISTFLDEVKTLYKFPLQAGTTLELSAENGGQAKLTFKIGLPEKVLAAGPTGGGPGGSPAVTVEVPVTASNSRGVTYGAKAQVSELWLGKKILIKEFSVAIDLGEETLTITGGLALNESFGAKSLKGAGADAVLDGTLKLKASDGALFGFLQELTVGVSDLERHIGGGFFLQRAALSLGSQSEGSRLYGKLGGSGRVSFGPKISQTLVFNGYLAAADATISLLFPANEAALNGPDPVRVVAEGSGTLLNLPVSKMTATQFWPDKYTLTGEIDLSVSGWGVKAQITEALFDINALEESELLVVGNASFGAFGGELRADAVVGRHGYGVCFGPAGSQVGLAQFLSLTQPAKVFANSCDIGAIRAQVAQAGVPARGLDVAPGTRVQTAIVQGAGGPPKVELRGPRGESFSTPAGSEPVSSRSHMIVQDTSRNATFVALFGPTSGRWELSARADGPAITRVQSATNLPRVRPRTTVRKLRNGRLQLTWSAPGLAGRSLQLAERAGASTRTLVSTRRARGTKTFTPMPASTRRRAIETRLVRDQIPGKATVTSRFTAADSRPGRASNVQLRSRRILTWSLPGAQRTVAVVTLPDGTTTSQRVSGRRLRLERRLPKGSRLTVTLTGLDALGRSGRPVTARLRAR